MMECIQDASTSVYLPKNLAEVTRSYETDSFTYDHVSNVLDCKLLTRNPYRCHFKQVYPEIIDEHELTDEMLDVLRSYTDSRSNECFKKTNLNLLSANFDQLDWIYVNKLRSLIRGLKQNNIKHTYYRGLSLSEREVQFYLDRRNECYYTNSFTSFTTDRLLVYSGNALLMLRTDHATERAKRNLAHIWHWSTFAEEKEALLVVGSKLRVASVRYLGCKWEIEVELVDDDEDID